MRVLIPYKSKAELDSLTHQELLDYISYVHIQMTEAYAEHCTEIKAANKELADLRDKIAAVKLILRD